MRSRFLRNLVGLLMVMAMTILLIAGPATAQVPLQTGLVANWSFNETSGIVAADAIAVGGVYADATWLNLGGESWTSGVLDGALHFDTGTFTPYTPGATVGNPSSLNLGTNSVTISTWVNLDLMPSAIANSYAGIYDSAEDNYVLYLDKGSKTLRFKVSAVGESYPPKVSIPEYKLSTGSWHHVVATYDGTYAKIYLDNQVCGAETAHTAGGLIKDDQVAGFGYQPSTTSPPGSNYFDGSVDETGIWNRALSAAEVAYLYNEGSGVAVLADNPTITPPTPVVPTLPNPVIHYEFENNLTNTGSTAGAYDGVLSTATDGSTSAYEAAQVGQGLRMNNLGEGAKIGGTYVTIPGYTLPDEGTISLWFKQTGDPFSYPNLFDNSINDSGWEMWLSSGTRMAWRLSSAQAQAEFSPTDEWHHYAATWEKDSSGSGYATFSVYVDGVIGAMNLDTWIDPGTFFLGGGNDGNEYAVGTFDDFRIYDEALTAEQIASLAAYDIPGDANLDGKVDAADVSIMAANWGVTSATWAMGDFSGNGTVGPEDAKMLAQNWGTGTGGEAAAVPEPSTLIMLLSLLGMTVLRRRRG